MEESEIGCQLFVYGQRAGDDFEGVLKEVSEKGCDGVETEVLVSI